MTSDATPLAPSSSINAVPVTGIGASAGGIPALQAFFKVLPSDTGTAYVVILHLDPEHQSDLAQILSLVTSMPVTEVGDATAIVANHV